MGQLRDRMRDDLRLRNYSERTIYGYLLYAKKFVARFMRPPEEITRDEVRGYLLHLMNERGLSASTYRAHRAAIKFLYEVTLGLPFKVERILPPKRERRLPEVRDSHCSTDWEICEDADLTARFAASLDDRTNLTSITAEAEDMFFEGLLANGNSLDHSKDYWVRARFKDDLGAAGDWSEPLHFRTGPFPSGEGWTYYGGGCSPAERERDGPPRPPCSGLDFLAFMLSAALLCRRKSPAVREGRPT